MTQDEEEMNVNEIPEQEDLGLDVPQSPADKIANKLLILIKKKKEFEEDLLSISTDLIDALKEEKRKSITVEGKNIYIDDVAAKEVIKVRKASKN